MASNSIAPSAGDVEAPSLATELVKQAVSVAAVADAVRGRQSTDRVGTLRAAA